MHVPRTGGLWFTSTPLNAYTYGLHKGYLVSAKCMHPQVHLSTVI